MLHIENAADAPEALDEVGRWHWQEWGSVDPDGSLEAWTSRLKLKANRDRVPLTLLAYENELLIGSVSLIEHDMPDRADLADLTPWVAGTFVVPEQRGRGVGAALMRAVQREAERLGIGRAYLYTSTAEPFYSRLGWTAELTAQYEGEAVTVMSWAAH